MFAAIPLPLLLILIVLAAMGLGSAMVGAGIAFTTSDRDCRFVSLVSAGTGIMLLIASILATTRLSA